MGTFPGKRDRDASFSLIVELVLVLLFIKNLGLKPRPFRTALHGMGGGLVPLFLLATALNILPTFDVLYSPFAWTVTGSCFLPVRIASGCKPVCIYPFAADYPRGYRLGRQDRRGG